MFGKTDTPLVDMPVLPLCTAPTISDQLLKQLAELAERVQCVAVDANVALRPVLSMSVPVPPMPRTAEEQASYPPLFAELRAAIESIEESVLAIEDTVRRITL
jgi:hypothetical protein